MSILFFGSSLLGATTSILLEWDPSPSTDVVSYNLYYGTASGVYDTVVNTGAVTVAQVTNLVCGVTYYFAATAVDQYGLESDFSPEISYTPPIPSLPAVSIARMNDGSFTVSTPAVAGRTYVLEASTDMKSWQPISTTVATSNDDLVFVDPQAAEMPIRFYRVGEIAPN